MIPIPLNAAGRIGLNVLLLLAGVVALRLGEPVIVPLLISLLLATVLGPAAAWLHETIKIRWGLACITVILGMVLTSALITAIFSASVARLANQFSSEDKILKIYVDFRTKLEKVSPVELDPEALRKVDIVFAPDGSILRFVDANTGYAVTLDDIGIFRYIRDAAPFLLQKSAIYARDWTWMVVMVLFITFFVMLEGKMLARRAVAIFGPSEEVQTKATAVLFEMANQVRNYLVWRTLINLGLAIVMGLIYTSCGLNQAWTWAILLAILNYIPYFGPVLASLPPFLDAFIFAGPAEALVVTVAFWVVVILEGYLVVPLLMGHNMDLNATTVMVACLFWELVWPGMTGLFLAMPIMAGIKAILYHVPEWRVWANLMSSRDHEDPGPPPVIATAPPPPGDSPNGKPGTPHSDGIQPAEGEGRSA